MSEPLKVCVCGGGSLAHVLVGVLNSGGAEVRVLTRQPARWREVRVLYRDELEVRGRASRASGDAAEVAAGADVIIIAVPSYARPEVLRQIRPHLKEGAWVGAFPGFGGFDWLARSILGEGVNIFGSQRIPYVCKKISYGESVSLTGIRPQLFMAAHPSARVTEISRLVADALNMRVIPMGNYLCVNLSLSNPTFHPARLYSLFRDWEEGVTYPRKALFYDDWDDTATEVFGRFDQEIQDICRAIPLDFGYVKPIVQHYEVPTLAQLTDKIRNIAALRGRPAPLAQTPRGYVPDFNTSYFTEDIPYGLVVIRSVAEIAGVPTPMMDEVIGWAQRLTGAEYLVDGCLKGASVGGLPIPQNFGINTLDQLVRAAVA